MNRFHRDETASCNFWCSASKSCVEDGINTQRMKMLPPINAMAVDTWVNRERTSSQSWFSIRHSKVKWNRYSQWLSSSNIRLKVEQCYPCSDTESRNSSGFVLQALFKKSHKWKVTRKLKGLLFRFQFFKGGGSDTVLFPVLEIEMPPFMFVNSKALRFHSILE